VERLMNSGATALVDSGGAGRTRSLFAVTARFGFELMVGVTALAVTRMERAAGGAPDLSAEAVPALDLVARAAVGSDAP
jgi:hypothetical protein